MKQETLEEAAENHWRLQYVMSLDETTKPYIIEDFRTGAKWMQERMYSEEDIKLAFEAGYKKGFSGYPNTENWKELPFDEWFKNIKK
jgi:hypothetical protein